MLDILVIAPHPDDAELGMGGAILKFKQEGRRVGVLDLTSGEPTPHGTPELRVKETAAATKILGLDWRENLGLPNRSLEADDRESGEAGGSDSAAAAASGCLRRIGSMRIRIMWRRRSWWMMRGFGRKLTKTDHAGRAVSSSADLQLLLRAFEDGGAAGVCARYQRAVGTEAGGDPVL